MNNTEFISDFSISKYSFSNYKLTGNVTFTKPCIGYVTKGSGRFLYNGKTVIAKVGDLIYIASGTKYYSVWSGNPEIEFYSVVFSFLSDSSFYSYRFQIIRDFPSVLFERMYKNHSSEPFLALSDFYILINTIYKQLIPDEKSKYTVIAPAIEYIEQNYISSISVSTLAKLCRCSESGLFKAFQRLMGVTPIEYKHNIIIQHALRLLSEPELSIEEISDMLGFSSSNYFRKVFYKITGKTPKELRKKNGNVKNAQNA